MTARTPAPDIADAADVQAALAHWQQVLQDIGFVDPAVPKMITTDLQRLQQHVPASQLSKLDSHMEGLLQLQTKIGTDGVAVRGFGIERMTLMRHGVDDIRELIANDVRFLRQF